MDCEIALLYCLLKAVAYWTEVPWNGCCCGYRLWTGALVKDFSISLVGGYKNIAVFKAWEAISWFKEGFGPTCLCGGDLQKMGHAQADAVRRPFLL
jgi:hypothetical protein